MNAVPKISCLMITLDRIQQVRESIACFCSQNYPNKELLIITDGTAEFRQSIQHDIQSRNRDDIRLHGVSDTGRTLGYLRNVSLELAHGPVICQWDDDDISHPHRLSIQFEYMRSNGARACFLTEQLQFFTATREIYWNDWRIGARSQGRASCIPGTLMMLKDANVRYPETGEIACHGEDSAILSAIYGNIPVAQLSEHGYLHIYTYHGRNTFDEDHHRMLLRGSISKDVLRQRRQVLTAELNRFNVPLPLWVCTPDERLFQIFPWDETKTASPTPGPIVQPIDTVPARGHE